jgi:hypothetical protein
VDARGQKRGSRAAARPLDHRGPELTQVDVQRREQLRTEAVVDIEHPEEHMLGAEPVLTERERLPYGAFQGLLGVRGEGNMTCALTPSRTTDCSSGDIESPDSEGLLDRPPDIVEVDAE